MAGVLPALKEKLWDSTFNDVGVSCCGELNDSRDIFTLLDTCAGLLSKGQS